METEVEGLIEKKCRIQDIESLTKSADLFAEQAEQKGALTLIAKSNAMRNSAKEKSAELSLLNDNIVAKEMKLKNA